jgi:hypothetical protein
MTAAQNAGHSEFNALRTYGFAALGASFPTGESFFCLSLALAVGVFGTLLPDPRTVSLAGAPLDEPPPPSP